MKSYALTPHLDAGKDTDMPGLQNEIAMMKTSVCLRPYPLPSLKRTLENHLRVFT